MHISTGSSPGLASNHIGLRVRQHETWRANNRRSDPSHLIDQRRPLTLVRPTPPTLDSAQASYVTWLRQARDLSDHTVRAYDSDTRRLVHALGPEKPVSALEGGSFSTFFDLERSRGRRSSTLRRRAAGVRSFCAYLESHEMVAANPWPSTGISFRRTRSLPRAISTHELQRLVSHLCAAADLQGRRPPARLPKFHESTTLLAVTLMVATGVRVGELVTIGVRDIDVEAGTIRVLGKGQRERVVYVTDPWQRRLVESYLRTRDDRAPRHDVALVNSRGERLSTSTVRARLAKASDDARLGRHLTPHMLRHTAATQLIESGVDIRFVQRLLGHASLSTTEIYTHVSDAALKSAVEGAGIVERSLARKR
jgi:site-specific recombinase XerD